MTSLQICDTYLIKKNLIFFLLTLDFNDVLMCLVLITILNLNTSTYPNAHFIYHRIFIFDTKIFHRLTIKIKLLCIFSLHVGWNIISKPRHSVRPITLLYIPTILIFICRITSRITGILL